MAGLLPDPLGKRSQQFREVVGGSRISQLAILVELVVRSGDENLGTVQQLTVQVNEYLPQMVLTTRRTHATRRGAEQCDRLAIEGLRRWARCPVDRVLQYARHRVVVLGCRDHQRIG